MNNQAPPFVTFPPLQTFPVSIGGNTYYAIAIVTPSQFPTSWLKIGLQNQALSFSAIVEGREVIIVIRRLTFISYIVSQGIRVGMEAFNNHLWVSSLFQHPMVPPPPQIPFFLFPSWEMPLLNPLQKIWTQPYI